MKYDIQTMHIFEDKSYLAGPRDILTLCYLKLLFMKVTWQTCIYIKSLLNLPLTFFGVYKKSALLSQFQLLEVNACLWSMYDIESDATHVTTVNGHNVIFHSENLQNGESLISYCQSGVQSSVEMYFCFLCFQSLIIKQCIIIVNMCHIKWCMHDLSINYPITSQRFKTFDTTIINLLQKEEEEEKKRSSKFNWCGQYTRSFKSNNCWDAQILEILLNNATDKKLLELMQVCFMMRVRVMLWFRLLPPWMSLALSSVSACLSARCCTTIRNTRASDWQYEVYDMGAWQWRQCLDAQYAVKRLTSLS